MNALLHDLRHALRCLRAQPGFCLTAVLTLMLGIGALTAIFTVYDAVLLKPLPFAQVDRIVRITRVQPPVSGPISPAALREWRERSGSAFDAFGAFVEQTATLTGTGGAERAVGYRVTPGFWDVFSQPIALGRSISVEDETRGERVVVLSDGLWRNRYGADPGVIGCDIAINGESWRVIGVAAPTFQYPAHARLWLPTLLAVHSEDRGNNSLAVVARLAPAVSLAQAREVMRGITDWQARSFPEHHANLSARIERLGTWLSSNLRDTLSMLLSAGLLVLLIACANLASLMLTRSQTRSQELAVRSALGAGRAQLIRTVLAEALLLAFAGALAAALFARLLLAGLLRLAPELLPEWNVPTLDYRALLAMLAVAMSTLLLSGLLPAWWASRTDPAQALRGGTRGQTLTRSQARARGALVMVEIALAVCLLSGAGQLIDTLRQLGQVDSGLRDPERILSARFDVALPTQTPGTDDLAWLTRVNAVLAPQVDDLLARLAALPGAESVALSDVLPASGEGGWNGGLEIEGHPVADDALVDFHFVSPDYFRTFGIALKAGRVLDISDGKGAAVPGVGVVNQAFVDRYLGGGDALGAQVHAYDGSAKTIVGVVGNVRQLGPDQPERPEIYFPIRNAPMGNLALAIRSGGDANALQPALRRLMRESFPDIPLYRIAAMDEVTGAPVQMRRVSMGLNSAFAATALILASIGLYGVITWIAAQRRREIGIRQSFGATRTHIHRLMLRSGLGLIVPGVAAGLLGAFALSRLLASQASGIGALNLRVLVLVAFGFGVIAIVACLVPTWRALRISPTQALRND
ncbi:MAG: ABC transporter permease [Dokdonella sp.]|nr:MAG: ABC transporter permease [Dokdonella sp.]